MSVGDELDPAEVPTVVFLHGLFGQGRNFVTIARGLVPAARSLLVDLPDHGRSAWTDAVDQSAMADAVAATIGEQVPGPVVLVGHSLGGKVAMLLALRHPELVRHLVVVDIAPAPSHGVSEFEHLLDSLATLDLAALEGRSAADAQLVDAIPNPTVRAFLLQNLRRDGDHWAWRANLGLLREQLDAVGGFPDPGGATFDGPVTWVVGERSRYTDDDDAVVMRRLFPRTRQVTVKGAGHWVHSEKPEAFGQILRQVLLRLEP